MLALPLAYIYAKPVLVLNSPKPDKLAFAKFVGWARQRYRQVYFLGGGGTDLLSSSVGVEPVVERALSGARVRVAPERLPDARARQGIRLRPVSIRHAERTTTGVFALDIGDKDDLYVVRFHAKERTGAARSAGRSGSRTCRSRR